MAWLHWDFLVVILDDFLIIPASPSIQSSIQSASSDHIAINYCRYSGHSPQQEKRVLGYKFDTSTFTLRVPHLKLTEACKTTADILGKSSISLRVDSGGGGVILGGHFREGHFFVGHLFDRFLGLRAGPSAFSEEHQIFNFQWYRPYVDLIAVTCRKYGLLRST